MYRSKLRLCEPGGCSLPAYLPAWLACLACLPIELATRWLAYTSTEVAQRHQRCGPFRRPPTADCMSSVQQTPQGPRGKTCLYKTSSKCPSGIQLNCKTCAKN